MMDRNSQKHTLDLQRILQGEIFFQSSGDEEVFHQQDLIQLFPFGISVGTDPGQPFLLLKNLEKDVTLPVAVSPLEAGVTLTHGNKSVAPTSPYRFTQELIKLLGLEVKQCVFVQIKGPLQFVRIYLSGHPSANSIKLRADEAMSLCIHLGIPIYATKSYINKSRLMKVQMEGLTEDLIKKQKILLKDQNYIM